SIGQGVETVIAQICSDILGVDYTDVRVVHGQTNRIDKGMGAFASRVTVMCGEATRMAAEKLREQALAVASTLMQTPADQLEIEAGEIRRKHKAGPTMRLAALAAAQNGLTAEAEFNSAHM